MERSVRIFALYRPSEAFQGSQGTQWCCRVARMRYRAF